MQAFGNQVNEKFSKRNKVQTVGIDVGSKESLDKCILLRIKSKTMRPEK